MNEGTLISGEPEFRETTPFTITASTTLFSSPADSIAMIRMEGFGIVPKVSVFDLDMMFPSWQSQTGTNLKYWFPFGLTKFGVYPKLTADAQVILTYVKKPVTTARPYTGTEPTPYQEEYLEAFSDLASHIGRLKEADPDFMQSSIAVDRFVARMAELSSFASRKAAGGEGECNGGGERGIADHAVT